jgi:hypothetical protein
MRRKRVGGGHNVVVLVVVDVGADILAKVGPLGFGKKQEDLKLCCL